MIDSTDGENAGGKLSNDECRSIDLSINHTRYSTRFDEAHIDMVNRVYQATSRSIELSARIGRKSRGRLEDWKRSKGGRAQGKSVLIF